MAYVDGHRDEFTYIISIYFHNFPSGLILILILTTDIFGNELKARLINKMIVNHSHIKMVVSD